MKNILFPLLRIMLPVIAYGHLRTEPGWWTVSLAMGIIACSCGSLVPTPTAAPQPPAGARMAGKWLDPDTSGTITTIVAKSGGFEAVSVINLERGGNCITSVTVSVSDSSLETTWADDRGYSGTTTFERQP
jgi:hypothetical protein